MKPTTTIMLIALIAIIFLMLSIAHPAKAQDYSYDYSGYDRWAYNNFSDPNYLPPCPKTAPDSGVSAYVNCKGE